MANQIKRLSILLNRWNPDDYDGRAIARFHLSVDLKKNEFIVVAWALSLRVLAVSLLGVYN